MYFDGINDKATIPSVDFHTTDFTIAFWFKYPKTAYGFFNFLNDERNNAKRMFTIYVYYGTMALEFFNVLGGRFGIGIKTK